MHFPRREENWQSRDNMKWDINIFFGLLNLQQTLEKCQLEDAVRKKEGKQDSRVIPNAHRIKSVLDSDLFLLLTHGPMEEYDSPTKLLEDKSSSFA
ncbi:hypothetical protein Ddye_011860 [Dipteronia dyeriana]|uniref:Uncharacterized protein n=1 Tax=Dipteronia dyeriana TaxID=168575 RepID=A0AAD9X3D8_9ROSI|nr:hypothetical protein Ddye_011860 [Dipteronia dyeriana]